MLLRRLYYSLKPFVPWHLRMAARRIRAKQVLKTCANSWPILESAARKPEGWPGWSNGRQFAFVLTHDVESQRGLDRVKQLAELEMSFGFRSSFNFIPEGPYEVPASLRIWLTERGFEVGVHDLHHDGKLYSSRGEFRRKAARINHYLQEWNATGFRSGFMLRNLDWLRDLKIGYDSSTFDTDPFEPQPDGAGTIFPFWVAGPSIDHKSPVASHDAGYVELPYTLPQDSTLFLILKETTNEIWLNKLDWVAERGGMALVNVHPDYLSFDDPHDSGQHYPVRHYQALLEHVATSHGGDFWSTTPAELTKWYHTTVACVPAILRIPAGHSTEHREAVGSSHSLDADLTGKRAAVLLFSYYPSDPRPRREAEALVSAGMEVEVFCLRESPEEPSRETINGVTVRRLPVRHRREGKLTYIVQYGSFIVLCLAALARRTLRLRYDLVHVHNMPDILVLAALVPKLLGARVILDLHDPMPELMMTIYGLPEDSLAVGLLRLLEKWSIALADRVVTVNRACKKIFGSRSCPPEKIEVIMNSPDESIFTFHPCAVAAGGVTRDPSKPFVLMCHGSIVERHGHDLAVAAVEKVKDVIPFIQLRIYGRRTAFLDRVMSTVREKNLEDVVQYRGTCSQEAIVSAIKDCDLGLIPNRRAIFTELNTPTRIFECLASGVPVISPRTPGILDYFKEDGMIYFDLGDADDLARRIEFAYHHPVEVREFVRRGQGVYRAHLWVEERSRLLRMTQGLLGARNGAALSNPLQSIG